MKGFKQMLVVAALAVAAVGWLATSASAAVPVIDKGTKEFSLGASITSDNQTVSGQSGTTTTTTQNVNGTLGYFLDKHQQVGGFVYLTNSTTKSPGASAVTSSFTYLEGFYKYHLVLDANPELVPYVGGYLGTISITTTANGTSSSGSGTAYAAAAGVKYFLNERMSANAEFQTGNSSFSIAGIKINDQSTSLFLSLSVYFGG